MNAIGAPRQVPGRRSPVRPNPSAQASRHKGHRSSSAGSALLWLESTILLGSCLVVWWLSTTFVTPLWSWVSLLQFLWLCLLCFRCEPQGFALFLPIVISRASVVVALIAIEYQARLPELGITGTAGPFTASYVVVTAVLFGSYLAVFNGARTAFLTGRPGVLTLAFDRYATPVSAAVLAAAIGATLWLLAVGSMRGFPLLVNMDRFVFRRLFADNLTLNILNCKALVASALGLVVFCLPVAARWKRSAALAFLVFVAVNFLFGDKFFIILMTASCFFAPYLYFHHRTVRQRLGRAVAIGTLMMAPILGVTWFIYSDQGRMSADATSQRLAERFAAQGELWYLQSRVGAPLTQWNEPFVAGNLEAMTIKQVDLFALRNGVGPAYFMNRYSPDKLRGAIGRNAGAVTYTMALEPLLLANFGWLGLVLGLVLCGGLFALGSLYIAYAIERRLILSVVFSGYIMVLMRSFSTQGGPWVIASVFTLKWLSVVLAIELGLLLLAA